MLTGVRIIEFEALGPAPFAGMLLADLGAEVIVIHRPGAADTPGKAENNLLDRGKRSITLDLKSEADRATARALIRSADALTEGMRPGVMERLGFGPDDALDWNPALVYGRMTGWGQTGPRARQAGHDINYLGLSGALFYAGLPGDVPGVPPTMLGDLGAGAMYLAVGLLAGLMRARATGQGTVVDAAIVDGASHLQALLLSMAGQFSTTTRGASLLDGPHWSRCYRCACGGFVAVQALEPKFYAIFLARAGLADRAELTSQFDADLWPRQCAMLEAHFLTETRDHWAQVFAESDACVAPVLSPAEAQRDPHITARGIWQAGQPAAAPRFDGAVPGVARPSPTRGQDTDTLLTDLRQRGFL